MSISVSCDLYLPQLHLQPFQLRSEVVQKCLQEVSSTGQRVPQLSGAVLPVTLQNADGADRSVAVVAEVHADEFRMRITVEAERVLVTDVNDRVALEDLRLVVHEFARTAEVHGTLGTVELGVLHPVFVDARLAALARLVRQRHLATGDMKLCHRHHFPRRRSITASDVFYRQRHLAADGTGHLAAFDVVRRAEEARVGLEAGLAEDVVAGQGTGVGRCLDADQTVERIAVLR